MRILGVDPGTYRTGAGLIECRGTSYSLLHAEVITLKAKDSLANRLHGIFTQLCSIIGRFKPAVLALEDVFFGKDLPAMVKVGEARACAMLAASQHSIDVVEYAPARIKQAISGNGRASKEQMQFMIQQLLKLKSPLPSDSADAVAIAICHHHSSKNLISGSSTWNAAALKNLEGRIAATT